MLAAIGGVILVAIFGWDLRVAQPVVDCVLYPDSCIKKTKMEISYMVGNYTVLLDKLLGSTDAHSEEVSAKEL